MQLVNFPKVRIVQTEPFGYIVQIQKRNWWGRKYWKCISASHMKPDQPWHYSDPETALRELLKHFEWEVIRTSLDNGTKFKRSKL